MTAVHLQAFVQHKVSQSIKILIFEKIFMMAKFIDLNLGISRFSKVNIPRIDPLALLFPGMFLLLMFPGSRNVIRVPSVAGLPSQTQIDISPNRNFTRLRSPPKCSDKGQQAETKVNDAFFETLSKENGFMIENYDPFDFLRPQKEKAKSQRQNPLVKSEATLTEDERKICKAYFILHED